MTTTTDQIVILVRHRNGPFEQAGPMVIERTLNWLVSAGEWGSRLTSGKHH